MCYNSAVLLHYYAIAKEASHVRVNFENWYKIVLTPVSPNTGLFVPNLSPTGRVEVAKDT